VVPLQSVTFVGRLLSLLCRHAGPVLGKQLNPRRAVPGDLVAVTVLMTTLHSD
jgi:hypothetical protein